MNKVTLIRLDTGQPFIIEATLQANADGSFSFKLPNGQYAGQDPMSYGGRSDSDEAKQYQRASLSGNVVTFLTRPEDPPYAYLMGSGKVYVS